MNVGLRGILIGNAQKLRTKTEINQGGNGKELQQKCMWMGHSGQTPTPMSLWGCTLNFLNHPFNIDLMPVELGSFDVIIADVDYRSRAKKITGTEQVHTYGGQSGFCTEGSMAEVVQGYCVYTANIES
ncbi:hypothetical protein Tco_0807710 [Tanacetum coccineum]